MIQKQYVKAVRAIVEAIFAEQGEADLSEHLESVLDFVIDQFHRMPDYLRPPLMALTVALDCWPYFQGWSRPVHGLPIGSRSQMIASWKRSRFGLQRDLIRFYESLAVYGLASAAEKGFDV